MLKTNKGSGRGREARKAPRTTPARRREDDAAFSTGEPGTDVDAGPGFPDRSYNGRNETYGGAMASTWSVLRVSCKRRSPVGLLKQPEPNASAENNLALAA